MRTDRWLAPTTAFLLSLVLFVACGGERQKRPNMVVIIADDLGYTDLGFMGNETVRTPNIDRLAAESARFTHAYVPTGFCRPSLATMLTGLYPHQHGIHFNLAPSEADELSTQARFEQLATLPRSLGRAGYTSLQTGKFWEGHFENAGFTHGMTLGEPTALAEHPLLIGFQGWYGDHGLTIGREGMLPIVEFLDAQAGNPFLIWFAPLLPHDPFDAPEAYLRRYQNGRNPREARYYAMIQRFDDVVGQLLELLDERQLLGDTIVVFIADNGMNAREFSLRYGSRPTRFGATHSKASAFELGVRTPLLIRWPGHTRAATIETPVSSVDLAPTLLAAAGLAAEAAKLPGVDLLPAAEGSGEVARKAVYGEHFPYRASVLDAAAEVSERWVRRGPWKLAVPADPEQPSRLYNLVDDPGETVNLANREQLADRRAELEELLDRWWRPPPRVP